MSTILNRYCSPFAIVLTCFLVITGISPLYGQDSAILEMLKNRDVEIKALLGDQSEFTESQRSELQDLINGVIDFNKMAQDALGSEWTDRTDEERAEFVKVFSEIVRGRSLADLEIYRLDVEYEDITVDGDIAHVHTTTVYKEQPMAVAYAMGFRENEWRVDDIILDGVSTTEGYARSFQTYIRKRGFAALMQNLYKRLEKMNAAD